MIKIFLSIFLYSIISFSESNIKIVFLGDSLTDGYGVSRESAYPYLVGEKLKAKFKNKSIQITNASISGSTTASLKTRMEWQLKSSPQIIVLALGANDGLRGLSVNTTEKNIRDAMQIAKNKNVKILLAGMKVPPNYGKKYQKEYDSLFPKLAKELKPASFMPFLLIGVAGEKDLNQADGIHPNEKGHKKMAENIYPYLEKLI